MVAELIDRHLDHNRHTDLMPDELPLTRKRRPLRRFAYVRAVSELTPIPAVRRIFEP
jgi:hypothetical protein